MAFRFLLRAACVVVLVASMIPLPANAGYVEGTITHLIVRDSDGLIYLHVNGTESGRPACAQVYRYWMIRDENSATGKRQYAYLMAAYLSGRRVAITGFNTCTRWGDGEDINAVELIP